MEPGSPTFNNLNKIVFGGQVQPDSLLKQRQEIVRIYYDSDNREVVFDVESNMPLREASDQRQSIDDVEQLCDNYTQQRTARAGSRLLILGFVFLLAANVYGAGF